MKFANNLKNIVRIKQLSRLVEPEESKQKQQVDVAVLLHFCRPFTLILLMLQKITEYAIKRKEGQKVDNEVPLQVSESYFLGISYELFIDTVVSLVLREECYYNVDRKGVLLD